MKTDDELAQEVTQWVKHPGKTIYEIAIQAAIEACMPFPYKDNAQIHKVCCFVIQDVLNMLKLNNPALEWDILPMLASPPMSIVTVKVVINIKETPAADYIVLTVALA